MSQVASTGRCSLCLILDLHLKIFNHFYHESVIMNLSHDNSASMSKGIISEVLMSTHNTENVCPRCHRSYTPGVLFCEQCGYEFTPADHRPPLQPQQSISSTANSLSIYQASLFLYLLATVMMSLLVGIVLNQMGKLPPLLTGIAGGIGAMLVTLSTLFGIRIEKTALPKGIWTNANRPIALLASFLTTLLLAGVVLLWPIPPHPVPPTGKLMLSDPLSDDSRGYNWEKAIDGPGQCAFTEGKYHAIQLQPGKFTTCTASSTQFSDFRYEVQMTIVKGDYGGILFRSNGINGNFYYFRIGQDGTYAFDISQHNNYWKTISSGYSSAIKTGLGQSNSIGVLANGGTFTFYVNNQELPPEDDATYTKGKIGVMADSRDRPTEVLFSDAKVWEI